MTVGPMFALPQIAAHFSLEFVEIIGHGLGLFILLLRLVVGSIRLLLLVLVAVLTRTRVIGMKLFCLSVDIIILRRPEKVISPLNLLSLISKVFHLVWFCLFVSTKESLS